MIELKTYIRKPFPVQGVLVTNENMEELATWCKGEIKTEKHRGVEKKFIDVPVKNKILDKQSKAYVGYWLLFGGKGFKVYTNRAFQTCFVPQDEDKVASYPGEVGVGELPLFGPPECVGAGE